MHRTPQPTLLVFTLGPGREQARRRWLGAAGSRAERRLHAACLSRVLDAGRANDCALTVATPALHGVAADLATVEQRGATFGERLLDAIATVEADASGPVVVVGTDTPDLGAELIAAALARLDGDDGDVVIGPSTDGGVYLLAFRRSIARELRSVRWCRPTTRAALVAALAAAGRRVHLLPALADLDSRTDLERWVATASSPGWRRTIGELRLALAALAGHRPWRRGALPAVALAVPDGRAPPA